VGAARNRPASGRRTPICWYAFGQTDVSRLARHLGLSQGRKHTSDRQPEAPPRAVALSLSDLQRRITIADDGPGLPEDQFENVFEPFVRLEGSGNRDTGGVGLGLAIARSIVRAHGGEITLANRPAGGLAATVQLPLERSP
jgi:signal transduction histidine kinase